MMIETTTLLPLDAVDPALIEALLDRAFEPERRQRTAYRLREGLEWLPALSFAAIDSHEHLAGTIQCWPIALIETGAGTGAETRDKGATRAHPMIMVGPVAVLPEVQGQGLGQALMGAVLSALNPQAPLPQVMVGDPDYYGRFWGFTSAWTGGWELPGPFDRHRLLVRCDNPAVLPTHGMLGPWR